MTGAASRPFGDLDHDRRRTSQERLAGAPWEASYLEGPAPWDIGRPQPAIERLAQDGGFTGAVLDVGCGTGENALHIASKGFEVLGVDVALPALAIARAKAEAREIRAEFAAVDAFRLGRLRRTFETVVDCGLFHSFDAQERADYVESLASVTAPAGMLYLLCFSDEGADLGPHPVREQDLREAFTPESGWTVRSIEPERIQTRIHGEAGAPAWLAKVERADAGSQS
jgi:SAM-dependent methyltransferase